MTRYNSAYMVNGTSALKARPQVEEGRPVQVVCTRGMKQRPARRANQVQEQITYAAYTAECIDEIKESLNLASILGSRKATLSIPQWVFVLGVSAAFGLSMTLL